MKLQPRAMTAIPRLIDFAAKLSGVAPGVRLCGELQSMPLHYEIEFALPQG